MYSYSLPSGFDKDIDKLEKLIEQCKKGEISPAQLKAHRVPFGVYEQRELDTYMLRIRCAGGYLTPDALVKISELASIYAHDQIHLTTREELQVHYLRLDSIIPVIRGLKEAGMASRGGGGNTVRNIIIQEYAGVDQDEVFDVTPYAIALTTRLISEDDSWTMPRKLKIAFSGSEEDKGYATISDIGFIAAIKKNKKGFKVYLAGGMGAKPQVGNLFFDFFDEDQVYKVTKTVKNLFWKYGNRKNKHAARLRFLWQTLGEEEFRKRFDEEFAAVTGENYSPLSVGKSENKGLEPVLEKLTTEDKGDFSLWKKRFVKPQKQSGLFSIIIPIELGFIANEKVRALGEFLRPFGDNVVRLSKDQNFILRNIKENYLANVYTFLKNNLDNFNRTLIFDKLISCVGASTCQLGICLARGATRAIMRTLAKSDIELDALADLTINLSGCPNACGQHHAADLGFFGKALRKEERMYPAYNVVAGASIGGQKTEFAKLIGEVSAKNLPLLVKDFLAIYLSKRGENKDFKKFLDNGGTRHLENVCDKYKNVPSFTEDKNYYFDWEAEEAFSLAARGAGECSAGLFDLIDVDSKNIEITRGKIIAAADDKDKQEALCDLTFYASRMLLITRGIEPQNPKETYENFKKYFIDTGLVDRSFVEIIDSALIKNTEALLKDEQKVQDLADRVKFLYENMDNAFQFNAEGLAAAPDGLRTSKDAKEKPIISKDFRGVACPMNFVKTKIELSKIASNDKLEILLDDGAPIDNVPGSVKAEGHKILEQIKVDDYWKVIIEKK